MLKKIVKFALYTLGGINLGAASAFFPGFFVILYAICDNMYAALAVSAGLCAIIATAVYLIHFCRRKKQHDSADYRASGAFAGFALGAVAIIVLVITLAGKGQEGPITGY